MTDEEREKHLAVIREDRMRRAPILKVLDALRHCIVLSEAGSGAYGYPGYTAADLRSMQELLPAKLMEQPWMVQGPSPCGRLQVYCGIPVEVSLSFWSEAEDFTAEQRALLDALLFRYQTNDLAQGEINAIRGWCHSSSPG